MKNNMLKVVTCALAMFSLAACGNSGSQGNTDVKEFAGTGYLGNDYFGMKRTVANVAVGGTYQIEFESLPGQYVSNLVKFKSNDTSVATVSESGVVTGVARGSTLIELKSADGLVDTNLRVYVGDTVPSASATATINNIKNDYSTSFVTPTKFFLREYDVDDYYCGDKVDHGYHSFQTMSYDYQAGYFMVESSDINVYTQNGGTSNYSGKWIFKCLNEGQITRLFHFQGGRKAFFDINTSKYSREGDAILAVLDMFFVSGRKIITNMVEYYANEDFSSAIGNAKTVNLVGDKKLSYQSVYSAKDQVVDADDEINYYDIYEGTKYDITQTLTYFQNSTRAEGLEIDVLMNYKVNDVAWSRKFYRSMSYFEDPQIEDYPNPDKNGFDEVYSIYDL